MSSDDWNDDWPSNSSANQSSNNNNDWGDDDWGANQSNSVSKQSNANQNDSFAPKGIGRGRAKRMAYSDDYSRNNDRDSNYSQSQSTSWGNSRDSDSNSSKRTIKVMNSNVGKVIGRGGSTIKDLEAKSGAKIKINKDSSDGYETEIDLIGFDDQCSRAEQLINDLCGSGYSNSSYSSRSHSNYESRSQSNFYDSQPKKEEEPEFEPIDWGAAIAESAEATRKKWAALPPIVKEFYFEDEEMKNMSDAAVNEFREQNNNIVVDHFNPEDKRPIPNPVIKFSQAFKRYSEILGEIEKQGFTTPSPIQTQSWPILLEGVDLIGIAQTGTGKTLAYLLPAMIHIENQMMPRSQRPGPTALILAPTRELAQQIEKEAKKYSYRDIKCVCIYGGGDRKQQISCVGKGVEIVIATPGRLNDLCMNRHIDLSAVSYLVLDEADKMLDMGFEPQIRKCMIDIRPDRHSVMMSATWPVGVRRLASNYMKDPFQIYVGTLDLAAVHTVTQTITMMDSAQKREVLYEFIRNMQPHHKVIIFVGRKALCDDLSSDCVLKGIDCQSMHGDRDQSDREQALDDIRNGRINILIATDVASRGLDIEDITHIFNFDFPKDIEEYVHRVGRTGRAGRTGEAITLFTREDWRHAGELIKILEEAHQEVPEELISMSQRYSAWKEKRDAEVSAYGGRRGGGGGGGRFGRSKW